MSAGLDGALLAVERASKHFGGLVAVRDVSFTVRQGSIKAIIGPNGAGKTTLFNLLTGFERPSSGRVRFRGHDLTGALPHEVARRGLARTFQNIRLFREMTVLENVLVARHVRTRAEFVASILKLPATRAEDRAARETALDLLSRMGLADRAGEKARNLTYGLQRRLELVRALASEPAVLLLDEPAAGLNAAEGQALARDVLRLREEGMTVLLIEHRMGLVMSISDEVLVLNFGEVIAEGPPAQVQADARVRAAYLGQG